MYFQGRLSFQFPFQEEKDKMERIKKDIEMLKEDMSEVRLGDIHVHAQYIHVLICTCSITLLIKLMLFIMCMYSKVATLLNWRRPRNKKISRYSCYEKK